MTRQIAITLALAGVLAACAGPRTPEPQVRIQRVEVPVWQPCPVEMPRPPASPVEALGPDASLGDMVKALLAERRLRTTYERELEVVLLSCRAGMPDGRSVRAAATKRR